MFSANVAHNTTLLLALVVGVASGHRTAVDGLLFDRKFAVVRADDFDAAASRSTTTLFDWGAAAVGVIFTSDISLNYFSNFTKTSLSNVES